jgi:WD40 repeat protein
MSRIFISHATPDNAKTRAIIEWIVSRGWPREDIFVDFDDIAGGERWREALKQASTRCEAVVFLISPEWAQRPWCKGEATTAQLLGKEIIPVLIEPTPYDDYGPLLRDEYQLIDLTVTGPRRALNISMPDSGRTQTVELAESGLQALRIGLERAGLAPSSFPLVPGRPIYPGLAPLDIEDAAVFFGRDAEIARGLKELRLTRDRGESLLAILAASGAGKSSFLRAGLWPRLQRADTEFLVLPVLRPGIDALHGEQGLVASLHGAGEALGLKRNRADWRAQLDAGDLAGALTRLQTAARTRLPATLFAQARPVSQSSTAQAGPTSGHSANPPIPVLPIDQAEELFGPQGGGAARRVLDLLGAALREDRLIAVCAIRTDRYGDLQAAPALAGLTQRPFSLPPIAEGALKEVIEGPAERDRKARSVEGLRIDPQLTDRLLRDWADADGLPLLAFTLRRLLDDYGSDGRLTLEEYEHSEQLRGALDAAITRAMQDAAAAGTLSEDPQAREALIRSTFVPWLISVDPQSQQAQRRIARRDGLPAASRDLIDRLIDARLLTCDRPQDSDARVEVAHEAILRHWPLLDRIIGQEREALIVLNEVKRDASARLASKKGGDVAESEDALLHRGERLRHAEQHLAREDFLRALGEEGRHYLAACRARENREIEDQRIQQAREARQIIKIRKMQRWAMFLLVAISVFIAVSGAILSQLLQTTNQSSVDVLASLGSQAFDRHEYERAVRLALAGVRKREATFQAIDIAAVENQLSRAAYRSSLRTVLADTGFVFRAIFSPDGRHIVSISEHNSARLWDTATGQVLRTMRHDGQVLSAAFSPDGTRIVTTSRDKSARLWETGSRKLLATMQHKKPVTSATFSRDGRHIVTVSEDNIARLWETGSEQPIANMLHDELIVKSVFSPDGRYIVTASYDETARLWLAGSEQPLATMPHEGPVTKVAFSPDQQHILTGSFDATARLWKAGSDKPLATMSHGDAVLDVAFSPDGRHIATASSDNNARIWKTGSEQPFATMPHGDLVASVAFSPDGRHIVTTSFDRTAGLWELGSNKPLATMSHENRVKSAIFSPDGRLILTTAWDNKSRLWETGSDKLPVKIPYRELIVRARFSPDSRYILTGSMDATARLWDGSSNKLLATMPHQKSVTDVGFSQGGRHIVTASEDGTVRVWKTGSERPLSSIQHSGTVFISPDGRQIVTASRDMTAGFWNVGSDRPLAIMRHDGPVVNAAFSPDGSHIVTISEDSKARLWKSGLEKPLATMQHDEPLTDVVFSPDGHHIVTVSERSTAYLWKTGLDEPLARMPHEGIVTGAAFSHDGRHIVTSSFDETARLWETHTGKQLVTMHHDAPVVSAAFSPDGTRIVTASLDRTTRIWDAASGKPLATMRYETQLESATFSPDGRRILVLTDPGSVYIWDTSFFLFTGPMLIEKICRDILNVDINAPPRDTDLSRLSDEELQMAPMIDPKTERDVCRPPTRWQRFLGMFGFGG